MNTYFKSALSKIKAEDELIVKTDKFLRTALEAPNQNKILYLENRSVNKMKMKKILVASIAAVFVIGTFVGGYTYVKSPVAYISLDINPSVELGINAFNDVISAEGVNDDGQTILEGQDVINNNVTDALNELIDSAVENDFIKDDGTSVISITAESNDDDKATDLTNISEQAVNDSIEDNKITAIVYKDCSDLSLRKEAKELGISPGKFKLIKNLQALDPTLTIDDLKDAKVSEIMVKANELISKLDTTNTDSTLSESQKLAIESLSDAAQKADDAKEKADKSEAKTKADELRDQAKALLTNTKDMTKEEKAAVKVQANELKKQAVALINNANTKSEEVKDTTQPQKDNANQTAKEKKETAKNNKEKSSNKNKTKSESTVENDDSDTDEVDSTTAVDNDASDTSDVDSKTDNKNDTSSKNKGKSDTKTDKDKSDKNNGKSQK